MKMARALTAVLVVLLGVMLLAGAALAEEKMDIKCKIKDYDLDNKTLVVTTDAGKEMTFIVENEKALKKLDDRLFTGDEVKIRYTVKDGKNVIGGANDLKGTKPGC